MNSRVAKDRRLCASGCAGIGPWRDGNMKEAAHPRDAACMPELGWGRPQRRGEREAGVQRRVEEQEAFELEVLGMVGEEQCVHRRAEEARTLRMRAVANPERLRQLDRFVQPMAHQDEVDQLTRLKRGRVDETRFGGGQPHAREERERPEVKRQVISAVRGRVAQSMRLGQSENAGRVGPYLDCAAWEKTDLLEWGVDPIPFDAV